MYIVCDSSPKTGKTNIKGRESQTMLIDYKRHRAVIERHYSDVATVYKNVEIKDPETFVTTSEWRIAYSDVPCNLDWGSSSMSGTETTANTEQVIKLLLPPEYDVPAGSKIEVKKAGRIFFFRSSAPPAIVESHQEIQLKLDQQRA